MAAQTLFEKIWNDHVVMEKPGEPALLYIDLHLIHEVTSPQAFEALRDSGRKVRDLKRTFATLDHNIPTIDQLKPIADPDSRLQVDMMRKNCRDFGVTLFDLGSREQGIVHVIGPELGLSQPGLTIVCGDSHTSTHGALGALAFGIGTSEVEHVLATQCLWQAKPKTFEIRVDGKVGLGITAKDLILGIIGRIGTDGATGCVIEYRGDAFETLSIEERMTVCNMSIEAGARAGMIAADSKTVEYLRGRRYVPEGAAFDALAKRWLTMRTDEGAKFDRTLSIPAAARRSVIRELVQEPINTRSTLISSIGVPPVSPMYSSARSIVLRSDASRAESGLGTLPVTSVTMPGLVPKVIMGSSSLPSSVTERS